MSVPFPLTPAQMRRIRPHFPLSRGVPRVDDRRVISGIALVIKGGLLWRDAPPGYGPRKTRHNRFVRWGQTGVSDRVFAALVGEAGEPGRLVIDGTPPQGPPHRGEPAREGALPASSAAPRAA